MPEVAYEDLVASAQAGQIVAVAPAIDDDGQPSLVIAIAAVPPRHRVRMEEATAEERVRIAVGAVRSVREHYGVADG